MVERNLAGEADNYNAKGLFGHWVRALRYRGVRMLLLAEFTGLIATAILFTQFFDWLQNRPGYLLNDPILARIQPADYSVPIFMIAYGVLIYGAWRAIRNPRILLEYVAAYVFLLWMRMLTLALVPLDPPEGLVALHDPIGYFLYGNQVVTRDLFFSGHTASAFLACLVLRGWSERRAMTAIVIVMGFLLLAQHIHYTIDVLAAFPFAWLCYRLAYRLTDHLTKAQLK